MSKTIGKIKIIDKRSGFVICKPDVSLKDDKLFYFNLNDYPALVIKEEDQINWTEDPDDVMSINNVDSAINQALNVEKV
ncbi:MAG: hypothetical protein JEZ03_09245 [Bacteroidales bacterium]|nr:hypothetical protein [Bacteroidales bacterium]